MTRLINLTPHAIDVRSTRQGYPLSDTDERGDDCTYDTIPPSGTVARVSVVYTPAESVGGLQCVSAAYGAPIDLPDYEDGVYLIVSSMVAAALVDGGRRTADILTPGQAVRDPAGRVVGCTALVRW